MKWNEKESLEALYDIQRLMFWGEPPKEQDEDEDED